MKLKSLLLAGLCLFGYASTAQVTTPQVVPNYNFEGKLCTHTQTRIPVQILGKFNDDNRFLVELLSYNYASIATYEAVLDNGNLVFTIGDDVAENYNRIDFRISTTSPATKTGTYSNNWYTRGQISISRPVGDSDTLNAGMSYLLNVDISANNPVTITLSDSSVREIKPNGYQQTMSLLASKSADIFIVRAANSCNVPVPFSGKAPLKLNPISIIPIKVNNQTALCEGSEIELSYAVSGGTLPESATFRLRIFKPYISGANEKRIFEVPATKKANGILVARIPENLVASSTISHIAILVNKPGLVSAYLQSVSIYQKPSASFRSESGSVGIGEAFNLGFNISGPKPFTVGMSNGVSYALDDNRSVDVYPIQTETYSISSLRSACGVTTDLPKQHVVATVPAGIAIKAPLDQKWSFCENQKVRLAFVSNTTFNASTKFTVEGITHNKSTYEFEAKVVNDSIEFLIPHSAAEWITEGYFNIRGFRIKTSNPSLTSAYRYGVSIRGIPRVGYETSRPRTLTGPQYYEYTLNVSGGLPYTLTDDQGIRSPTEYPSMPRIIFVPATGGYGLKSVENGCFSNTDLAKLNLTVNPYTSQTPAIVVHPSTRKYLCQPDSVEISFEAFGTFGEGNVFQILGSANNYSAPLLTVSKPGTYKIAASVLGTPSYTWMAVKATNPAVQGEGRLPFIIDTPPALLYPEDLSETPEKPRVFGIDEIPSIAAQFRSHSTYVADFTDGTKDYHFEKLSESDYFRPVIPKSKLTPYTLKSISNACGTLAVNRTTYLYWIGYTLSTKYFTEDQHFCTGQELLVPFNIERGSAPANMTFHLQISKGTADYKTVASKATLEDFRYMVPDSMTGSYLVRVISDEGVETGGKRFFVNKTPTATVSLRDPSASEIEYGQSVYIEYNLTGGGPWEMIVNGQGNVIASYSPFTYSYTLNQGAIFELRSVSNQCGYGTVSGSAAVQIKPRIITFQSERSSICSGEAIRVKYQVGGDIPSGEHLGFYLKNTNGTKYELQSVNAPSGTVSLPVPATLPGGYYELVCQITGSDISESRPININKTPDIELTGNTTINTGESAILQIRSTNAGNVALDVTLSNGAKAMFYPSGQGSSYYVTVTPSVTTTYTIVSATGSCGTAKATGSATVTVNPPAARTVRITGSSKNTFCEKDTLLVQYAVTGTFTAGNQFVLQIFDSQGKVVNSLPTTGKGSALAVVIPAGFSVTEPYRIRLVASDANTVSSDYQQVMMFGMKANASFASSNATLNDDGKARAVVLLTGTGPWRYSYGNELGAIQRYTDIAPDTLLISSKEQSAYFRLLSVTNGCGAGAISEPATIRVEIVLGTEEPARGAESITFGPNPTNGRVMLRFKTSSNRQLSLYNTQGVLMRTMIVSGTDTEVDMQPYASGSYLMKVEHEKGKQMLRIVKE